MPVPAPYSPTLAVTICNYNHGRYLTRCLDAVLTQGRLPDQLIILDDGSTDGSVEILDAYQKRHPWILILKNPANLGLFASIRRVRAEVRSTHLYSHSADDFVRPGFFEEAMHLAASYPEAGLIAGEMTACDPSGSELYRVRSRRWRRSGYITPDAFVQEYLLTETASHALGAGVIYRTDTLQEAGDFRSDLGPLCDTFTFRFIGLKYGIGYLARPSVCYTVEDSAFSQAALRDPARMRAYVDATQSLMKSEPYAPFFPEGHPERWAAAYRRLIMLHALPGIPALLAFLQHSGCLAAVYGLYSWSSGLAGSWDGVRSVLASRWARFIKVAVTLLLAVLILRGIDTAVLGRAITAADPPLLLVALILSIGSQLPTAACASELFAVMGIQRAFGQVLKANFLSIFFSYFGMIAGAFARWHHFSEDHKYAGPAAAVIFIERLLGLAISTVLLAGLTPSLGASLSPAETRAVYVLAALAALTPAVCLIAITLWPAARKRVSAGCVAPLRLISATGWTVLSTAMSAAALAAVLRAAGIGTDGAKVLWVAALGGIVQFAPVTVLGIGIREGVLIFAFERFGVPRENCIAAGVLLLGMGLIQSLAGGWLQLRGLSTKRQR